MAVEKLFSSLHPQLPSTGEVAKRALDLGCGSRPIFKDQRVAKEQFGADIQPAQCQVPVAACDGSRLPFGDRTFDLVTCRVAIPYMQVPASLREIHRILTQGGRFWATLHLPRMALKRIGRSARRGDLVDVAYQAYALVNGALLMATSWQIPWIDGRFESVQTPRSIERQFRRAGFADIATELCPDDAGLLHFAVQATKDGQS